MKKSDKVDILIVHVLSLIPIPVFFWMWPLTTINERWIIGIMYTLFQVFATYKIYVGLPLEDKETTIGEELESIKKGLKELNDKHNKQ